jgi:magnesium transporter
MDAKYPPETAGSNMTSAAPRISKEKTVADAVKMLFEQANKFDTLDYIYVVDTNNILTGVVSIKELLRSPREAKIKEIMSADLVKVLPQTEQEDMVYIALSHNIKAVPVVNEGGQMLGVVPYDAILNVFNEEVREDVFRFGGIFHRVGMEFSTIRSPMSVMFRKRVPWLLFGVLGGTITALIVGAFENTLSAMITLASFIPVMAFLSDAAGTQSETLAVRSLAIEPKLSKSKYIAREIRVALSLAVVCGFLMGAMALVGWRIPVLGFIVGVSMFLSIMAAISISTVLPFIFRNLGFDPAFASGPFATMISDTVTIAIYFLIASEILLYFGTLSKL